MLKFHWMGGLAVSIRQKWEKKRAENTLGLVHSIPSHNPFLAKWYALSLNWARLQVQLSKSPPPVTHISSEATSCPGRPPRPSELKWTNMSPQPSDVHSRLCLRPWPSHTTCWRTLLACSNTHDTWGNKTTFPLWSHLGERTLHNDNGYWKKWPVTKAIPIFQIANCTHSVLGCTKYT